VKENNPVDHDFCLAIVLPSIRLRIELEVDARGDDSQALHATLCDFLLACKHFTDRINADALKENQR
jgi:hypothetical protein